MRSRDRQRRGYELERLLLRLLEIHQIPVVRSFRRNAGAEQIDGAFKLDGWLYLLECRWRAQPADTDAVASLEAKLNRSGRQTMGVMLSINRWSPRVPDLLKQNPSKAIILMDGGDLRAVLEQRIGLLELLEAKITRLNLDAEPFLSARSIEARRRSVRSSTRPAGILRLRTEFAKMSSADR